jgi:hypothetical protein
MIRGKIQTLGRYTDKKTRHYILVEISPADAAIIKADSLVGREVSVAIERKPVQGPRANFHRQHSPEIKPL